MYKWYESIDDEIKSREKTCGINGMTHMYNIEDPYQYGSYPEFIKNHPRNENFKKKDPHCVSSIATMNQKDKKGSTFKNIRTKTQCDTVRGVWDENSINRKDKFSKGACYVTNKDQYCGSKVESKYLLSRDVVDDFEHEEARKKSAAKCKQDEKLCAWVKNKRRSDCISRHRLADSPQQKQKIAAKPADFPPDDMPIDITNPDTDIQGYLSKWYSSPTAPKTNSLEKKKGNQCVPQKATKASSNATITEYDINTNYTIKELRQIKYPLTRTTREILRRAFGKHKVSILEKSTEPLNEKEVWETKELYRMEEDISDDDPEPQPEGPKDVMIPSIPQSVINMIFKNIAKKPSAAKGLLAWHSTGSGKTATAAGVMEAMWDSGRPIIFMSSIEGKNANEDVVFHTLLKKMWPRFQKKTIQEVAALWAQRGIQKFSFAEASNRLKKTQAVLKELNIDPKRAKIDPSKPFVANPLTYIKETYGVKDEKRIQKALKANYINPSASGWSNFFDIDNAMIIIDEVHNLFRPLANQKGAHAYVEKHLYSHPNSKIVILTATPGDNVGDVLKLLNIVRSPGTPEIKAPKADEIHKFKASIAGLVSYFDMSSDEGKFPKLRDPGPTKYPMSHKQFVKYVEAFKEAKDKKTVTDYDSLAKSNRLAKWWASARKYSNMLYNFEDNLALSELSSKLPPLLEKVQSKPDEKHYIYSAFYENRGTSQGVLEIARQLEANGYKNFTLAEAKRSDPKKMSPEKRYVLITQKELGEGPKQSKNLLAFLKIYNAPENKDGQLIHVMIASQGFNEGLDLKAVRHIHIFEPLVTMASDKQTIGRARRYCSHADLDDDKWDVTIHRYMSDLPIEVDDVQYSKISMQVAGLEAKVAELSELAKATKGKEAKEAINSDIKNYKAELKELNKVIKEKSKLQDAEIANIDEFVYKESKARFNELRMIYHSMKEAAIDCKILSKFHDDVSIICGRLPARASSPTSSDSP